MTTNEREAASARVREAIARGQAIDGDDLLICDIDALRAAQRACMEFRVPHGPTCDCPWCRGEKDPAAALREDQRRARTAVSEHVKRPPSNDDDDEE